MQRSKIEFQIKQTITHTHARVNLSVETEHIINISDISVNKIHKHTL